MATDYLTTMLGATMGKTPKNKIKCELTFPNQIDGKKTTNRMNEKERQSNAMHMRSGLKFQPQISSCLHGFRRKQVCPDRPRRKVPMYRPSQTEGTYVETAQTEVA